MNKKVFYLLVLLGALLIGAARRVQAQIAESVDVKIPFQFYAGGKELPAGKYNIRSITSADDSTMEMRRADGQVVAIFETERSDMSATMKDNEVIFNQVGDNYFLSQIVDADKDTDTEVLNSDYGRKEDTGQHPTGRKHVFAFVHAL